MEKPASQKPLQFDYFINNKGHLVVKRLKDDESFEKESSMSRMSKMCCNQVNKSSKMNSTAKTKDSSKGPET